MFKKDSKKDRENCKFLFNNSPFDKYTILGQTVNHPVMDPFRTPFVYLLFYVVTASVYF